MSPIRIDCRSYTGSAPCRFHKADGRSCDACGDYDPVRVRLLIVKLAATGDVLRTTSLLPAMARAYPGAHVTWITDPASAPVLAGHPLVDRLLTSDQCLPTLLVERFDAVHGLDAEHRSASLSTLATASRRTGFVLDEYARVVPATDAAVAWWLMGLDDRRKRSNRRSYQDLMYELCGLPGPLHRPYFAVPEPCRQRAAVRLDVWGAHRHAPLVGLNTGGGSRWAQKKWTPEGYAGFIARLRAVHPRAGVVVVGGPDERDLNARLLEAGREGVFDAGCDNSFADFAALVSSLDVLVTSDSLGLHTAQAVSTPVVAFAGPTSPWELETYDDGAVVYADDVECVACYRARCDKPVTCMERLAPEPVLDAVERLLAATGIRPASGLYGKLHHRSGLGTVGR